VILRLDVGEGREAALDADDEAEYLADGVGHAETEAVYLEELQGVQIVLVPLHHGAPGHRDVLDGHQFAEQAAEDHEVAHVLGGVARKARELSCETHKPSAYGCLGVETRLPQPLGHHHLAIPPAERFYEDSRLTRARARRLRPR
jgi:hypothetical protein